jgi:S1-C subfamily serine protease
VTPSTETMRSPGSSVFAAGNPFSITSTVAVASVGSRGPISAKYENSSANASTRFIAGPAAITTIRFHTGCEW